MNEVAEERVARGATWLDENAPGWEHKLSFQELDMGDGCHCVLGQVFFYEALANGMVRIEANGVKVGNGFNYATGRLTETDPDSPDYDAYWDVSHGFDHGSAGCSPDCAYECEHEVTYQELYEAWVNLVKDRFNTGDLSG